MNTDSVSGGDRRRPLRFVVRFPGDTHAILELEGELDIANTHVLASVLDAVLVAGVDTVEIDTTNVDFAGCSFLGVIDRHAGRFSGAGGALVLAGTSPAVQRLLQLAGSDDTVEHRPLTQR
ncbi:MAG TPA: STAS domain-containing protein [Ilumatobacteraceae bacterium]